MVNFFDVAKRVQLVLSSKYGFWRFKYDEDFIGCFKACFAARTVVNAWRKGNTNTGRREGSDSLAQQRRQDAHPERYAEVTPKPLGWSPPERLTKTSARFSDIVTQIDHGRARAHA